MVEQITNDNDRFGLKSLLLDYPNATNGDLEALEGFLTSTKPASHLPAEIDQVQAEEFLDISKVHIPDARLFLIPGINIFLIYSPSAIKKRIEKENKVAQWLDIHNDSLDIILEKHLKDGKVEGFILGYPYSALRTFERSSKLRQNNPSFHDLLCAIEKDKEFLKIWDPEDLELLKSLSTRFNRIRKTKQAVSFVNLPMIKPVIRKFYEKYFQVSEDDLNFMFSIKAVKRNGMNYADSDLIQAGINDTKEKLGGV